MARRIEKIPEHVYMVVDETYTRSQFYGPYSTLSAAKGKRTTLLGTGSFHAKKPDKVHIMKSPAGDWERVDL